MRRVFDHVTIRVSDRAASEQFYETVLTPLGIEPTYRTGAFTEWRDFSLTESDAEHGVTRGLHIGFVAPSREQVDDFWQSGTRAGHADDGPPGPRPEYTPEYYGAFLRDPDSNSVEAVVHENLRADGVVDHVWLRVADLAAATRFYQTIAPVSGYALNHADEGASHFHGRTGGSLTLVPGEPTRDVHLAFGTNDDADVQRFHELATAAGHPSHGRPGERPQYHPGYYAAYVLDPDGNNIELVNHHRS